MYDHCSFEFVTDERKCERVVMVESLFGQYWLLMTSSISCPVTVMGPYALLIKCRS